jgi:ribosomal protein L19
MHLEKWWNDEFMEFLAVAQDKLQDEKKIKILFQLVPGDKIQASVASTETRKYIVKVFEGLRYRVYKDTNIACIFDRSLGVMSSTYKCTDELIYLQKVLCIITWLLVLGHELGHIINGHLGNGVSLRFIRQEVSRLAWTPGDQITDKMRIRSVKEYEADAYSGMWAGVWPSRMQLSCKTIEDKNNLGMSLTIMAAQYLVTLLNTLGDGYPWYPPNSIRIITIISCFLYSYGHVQKTGQLPENRIEKIVVDSVTEDPSFKVAVNAVNQDLNAASIQGIQYNKDTMNEWLIMLKAKYDKKIQNLINKEKLL